MESQRISAQKYNQETFYKLYKFLFKDDRLKQMTDSAKIAYTLFRDRFYLSQQNNWIDKNGHIYLHFTIAEICDVLGCANQKATKLKRELKQFGLLEEERVGFNKPNKIYMLEPKLTEETPENTDVIRNNDNHDTEARESNVGNHDNHTSRNVTITHQEMWKSLSNKNYSIKTNTNKTNMRNGYSGISGKDDYTKHSFHTNHQSDSDVAFNYYTDELPAALKIELKKFSIDEIKIIKNLFRRALKYVNDNFEYTTIDIDDVTHEIIKTLNKIEYKRKKDYNDQGTYETIEALKPFMFTSFTNAILDFLEKEYVSEKAMSNYHEAKPKPDAGNKNQHEPIKYASDVKEIKDMIDEFRRR